MLHATVVCWRTKHMYVFKHAICTHGTRDGCVSISAAAGVAVALQASACDAF